MADCKKYMDMISCYADGELPEQEQKLLLAHLDGCASCRALLSAYRSISEAAEETLVQVPDGFTASVMEKIRKLPRRRTGGYMKAVRPVIISFAAAAACLALVFTVSPQWFDFGRTKAKLSARVEAHDTADMAERGTDSILMGNAAPDASSGKFGGSETAKNDDENLVLYEAAGASADVETPQTGMGVASPADSPVPNDTAQDGQPVESTSQATRHPGIQISIAGVDENTLIVYYAVFTFEGALPDHVTGVEKTDRGGGLYSLVVSADVARELINDGYTNYVIGNQNAETALVYYTEG
jgi:hypothetical protein